MGTSSVGKRVPNSEYIPGLLISFTKIKEFCEYFKYQKSKDKIISTIFNSLIENNFLDGFVVEFNKILSKKFQNIKDLNINQIIEFILNELHEENNELKNNNSFDIQPQSVDNTNELETYNNFLKYYESNKSIITDLFFREDESISICSKCKNKFYFFLLEKMILFDMSKYYNIKKDNLNLLDLINKKQEKIEKSAHCEKCKINTNILNIQNFKTLPEIFIISFDNINYNRKIEYYLNMNYGNEEYVLIGIIINKNEKNEDVLNYNVFYKDKLSINKWLIYDTSNKDIREVKDIKNICQNPLVCYYQKKITHIKIYLNKLYNQLSCLYNDLIYLEEKIYEHIFDAKKFEKYYIVNKNWFNKLTKILEEEEVYNNDISFESFNDIINIHNLDNNNLNNIYELLQERIRKLSDEKMYQFMPEFDINEETNIKYPKNFVLISEKYLNFFLKEFGVEIKNKEKALYDIIYGENNIFIKDINNNNVYFVCSNLLFLLNVEKIFIFNEERYFEREINDYIKDKGLESYYEIRKLDVDSKIQNIIDKDDGNIGQLISIINDKTMANINK